MNEFWENSVYRAGKFPRCPYEYVASFVFRYAPRGHRKDVSILEIGCGGGNNLWFLEQEGFDCAGCDGSPSAIEYARKRAPGAEFKVAALPEIPFERKFDLAIDRGALSYVSLAVAKQTLDAVGKVLKSEGNFFLSPYSSQEQSPQGVRNYTRDGVEELLKGWKILEFHHVQVDDVLTGRPIRGEWHVVAQV